MSTPDVKSEILGHIIRLETEAGHLKWKISDLARHAGVSRALVYYHFGNTKEEILKRAIEVIAEDFYALSGPRSKMAANGQLLESLLTTRRFFLKIPSLGVFYQKWRFEKSETQNQLIEIENRYQAKLHKAFPHLAKERISSLHALFHGLITAPFGTENELKSAFGSISREFSL